MERRVSEESAPSMKLSLGIGAGDHGDDDQDDRHVFPQLTDTQLHELKQQALIFKYIAAGLRVPPDLVVPIWHSVASSSLGSFSGVDIYRQFPSFVGLSPQGFDYRQMMDPEPGRCRRTDGKKWRCSKDVVAGQKYCERHMHRGRQRSRKLVEASQTAAASEKPSPHNSSKNSDNSTTHSSTLAKVSSQIKAPPLDNTPAILTTCTTSCNSDIEITGMSLTTTANADRKNPFTTMTTSIVTSYKNTATMIASAVHADITATGNDYKSSINLKRHYIDDRNSNCSNSVTYKGIIDKNCSNKKIKNAGSNISQGLNFSPKSVLQVQGCGASHIYMNDVELELGRCRRTDGKKWRCRRDVVANQKYCEMHMHRGSKQHLEASKPAAIPATIPFVPGNVHSYPTMNLPNKADCRSLNTDLCISIPTSPQLIMTNDDTRTISNSSDTTISDTMVGTYQNKNLSS
ncbi:PREDICTED: growth-regulating factor 9 [Populus euphratica]|uniref:Growth-regulating factor n=1 Tax=Populus euphratica TaxID=75702 RepID=A0AAJ6UR93_POPEU|nr:PREDICTED: growth-regulating factor 9 [Populus euphratica]XP_011034638.1 PREDICTED: growth-regulating factor 9 [Populus euphratica]